MIALAVALAALAIGLVALFLSLREAITRWRAQRAYEAAVRDMTARVRRAVMPTMPDPELRNRRAN